MTAGQGAISSAPVMQRIWDWVRDVSPGANHTLKHAAFGGSTSGAARVPWVQLHLLHGSGSSGNVRGSVGGFHGSIGSSTYTQLGALMYGQHPAAVACRQLSMPISLPPPQQRIVAALPLLCPVVLQASSVCVSTT